jgi:hypothetical protein
MALQSPTSQKEVLRLRRTSTDIIIYMIYATVITIW